MPRPFEIPMGPPYTGLNTYQDPTALAPGQLAGGEAVDISRGTARAFYGPGTTVANLSAGTRHAYYLEGVGFIGTTFLGLGGAQNWACRDSRDASNNQVMYTTNINAAGAVLKPHVNYGASAYELGLEEPQTGPGVTNGGSGGVRAYTYTFWDDNHGYESNPYRGSITTTNCNVASLTGLPLTPPNAPPLYVSSATHIRVYGTAPGSVIGTYYFLGQFALGTTTFTDSAAGVAIPGDKTQPLNWGRGGTPKRTALPADHAPAPTLTCLSDGLHSAFTSDTNATGLGILFGALDNYVFWSMLGKPYYWPSANCVRLPYPVQAIITRGPLTYAFTEGGVWMFSGVSDVTIQVQRCPTAPGILRLAGKSAAQTPYGIVYLTREGPTLLDGVSTRPLCAGVIDPISWVDPSLTLFTGAYHDGYYLLQAGLFSTWMLDLRGFPNVVVSNCPLNAAGAFVVVPYDSTGPTPGLYVVNFNSGTVKPWSPLLGALIPGAARLPWFLDTGRSALDNPGKLKRLRQIRAVATGPLQVTIAASNGSTVTASASVSVTTGTQMYRLPAGFQGTHFIVQLNDASGGAELFDLALIGEVFDGD